MREILFRGKHADNGDWVEGYLVINPQQKARIYLQPFEGAIFNTHSYVDAETVGQFTGLTDTKGQKIFEGDKIKFKYHLEDFETANVFWSPDYLGFFTDSNHAHHPLYDLSEIEIIGNIHDNKEDKV